MLKIGLITAGVGVVGYTAYSYLKPYLATSGSTAARGLAKGFVEGSTGRTIGNHLCVSVWETGKSQEDTTAVSTGRVLAETDWEAEGMSGKVLRTLLVHGYEWCNTSHLDMMRPVDRLKRAPGANASLTAEQLAPIHDRCEEALSAMGPQVPLSLTGDAPISLWLRLGWSTAYFHSILVGPTSRNPHIVNFHTGSAKPSATRCYDSEDVLLDNGGKTTNNVIVCVTNNSTRSFPESLLHSIQEDMKQAGLIAPCRVILIKLQESQSSRAEDDDQMTALAVAAADKVRDELLKLPRASVCAFAVAGPCQLAFAVGRAACHMDQHKRPQRCLGYDLHTSASGVESYVVGWDTA